MSKAVLYACLAVAVVAVCSSPAVSQGPGLPSDDSIRFIARELVLLGNARLSTEELLRAMPDTYNAGSKPLKAADPADLYDLTAIKQLSTKPGQDREVTARQIRGFTKYILAEYQKRGYSGVFVYVPADTVIEGIELKDKTLVVQVVEAEVSQVNINLYSVEKVKKEQSFLNLGVMREWSPVKEGKMMSEKELESFINQVNLNPDKHVVAGVSKGQDGKTLAVNYDLYERSPWHFFIQADSSGTDKREWSPRAGIINTDLTGRMDRATVMYQAKPDELDDNYALYGSYEVPLWTPGLKLTGFAGYSQFDTNPVGTAPITFQGNGYFYGGRLRYNVAQWDKWFLDVVGGVTHVRSRFTPSLFEEFLRSDIRVNYWDVGAEVYRTGELDETRLAADRFTSFGGSSDAAFEKARWDTDSDFEYNVLSASRSQFFDFSRAHRLLASARWIIPNDRLTPSIMTTFGGLYSVRGYHEDEVVADGGIIASLQYEYDLLAEREDRSKNQEPMSSQKFVRRLAPVVFTDFGRAKTKNPLPDEAGIVEMASVGTGLVTTIGDHFDGAVYYGWALRGTEETDSGEGRWGASLLLRW